MNTLRRWAVVVGTLLLNWGRVREDVPYTPPVLTVQQAVSLREVFMPKRDVALTKAAVQHGMAQCGVPQPCSNLAATGKLYEVLHHASLLLGIEHGLSTVDDMAEFLSSKL